MKAVLLVALVLGGIRADYYVPQKTIPEQIIETVVKVDTASGIVVYSDAEMSLVLTAFHVIANNYDFENNIALSKVSLVYILPGLTVETAFRVVDVAVDIQNDLAILKIEPKMILPYTKIAKRWQYPRLGDDIWIAGNPLQQYRSLKKGMISSVNNRYSIWLRPEWEISGGVIFGVSGGGAFSLDGQLFGITDSVAMMRSDDCWEVEEELENGKKENVVECQLLPVPYIGFIIPPYTIRQFLTEGSFKDYFQYLK